MALKSLSAFIYGHTIDDNNQFINFTEDGINELTATVEVGSYTLTSFLNAVATALNDIGDNEYTVTVDRDTRLITISANGTFDLLVQTGTQSAISAFPLIGFTSDKSGASSYVGDVASGFLYEPQTKLYSYVPFENNNSTVQSKVNESSNGDIELVTYGNRRFAKFNIKYITDITGQSYINDNPNALQEANTFMDYIRLKRPFEFIIDKTDFSNYYSAILESTPQSQDGTSYELEELYAEKLAFYYQTGIITIRQIEV